MAVRSAILIGVLAACTGVGCAAEPDGGRRQLNLAGDSGWAGYGVSYGPFRAGQRPGGPGPSVDEIREDLRLLDADFDLIRIYGSDGIAEDVLRVIHDEGLGLRVLVGAWLVADRSPSDPDDEHSEWVPDEEARAFNRHQVDGAIRLANAYPGVVWGVNIGNETQVWWSDHRLATERLIGHLRRTRVATSVPVTTADDYNFWNKPESVAVSAECDFIALHAYAMWNSQPLSNAVAWTQEQVEATEALHPGVPVVLTEAGWATSKTDTGWQGELITGEAGDSQQLEFTRDFLAWATEREIPHFLFEAFDEPWKGGEEPAEVEKNWGLWYETREPKPAAEWLREHGPVRARDDE